MRADEGGDELVGGAVEDLPRRADLLDPAPPHDGDAIRQREGLRLVVGDEHRGDAQVALELLEEGARLQSQSGVQVGQGLVEQEHVGPGGDGPGQGDALLLPAGQLGGPALEQLGQGEALRRVGGGPAALGLGDPAYAQRVGDVVRHVHVGEEGVVLEDHGHAAPPGLDVGHVGPADAQGPLGDGLQAGDGSEQGRLAASRGAQQGEELAVVDGQVHPVHAAHPVGVLLHEALHDDRGCHDLIPP